MGQCLEFTAKRFWSVGKQACYQVELNIFASLINLLISLPMFYNSFRNMFHSFVQLIKQTSK